MGPLHLANALATCVLSARLHSDHRQWAAQQLVRVLGSQKEQTDHGYQSVLQGSPVRPRDNNADIRRKGECMVDLSQDLPSCSTSTLEAHQNRLTGCVYNMKKSLLASRSVLNSVGRHLSKHKTLNQC